MHILLARKEKIKHKTLETRRSTGIRACGAQPNCRDPSSRIKMVNCRPPGPRAICHLQLGCEVSRRLWTSTLLPPAFGATASCDLPASMADWLRHDAQDQSRLSHIPLQVDVMWRLAQTQRTTNPLRTAPVFLRANQSSPATPSDSPAPY